MTLTYIYKIQTYLSSYRIIVSSSFLIMQLIQLLNLGSKILNKHTGPFHPQDPSTIH
jgi:hypothetical protein